MKSGNIYLVGFMGAGKTSVGMRLAELLRRDFVDLDRKIEEREGRSIREMFSVNGEAYFRALEQKELQRVAQMNGIVIALGGGAFMDIKNRETIASSGTSVWLDASMDTLYPRCAGDPSRPLMTSRAEMELLLDRRRPYYQQATLRVAVDGRSVDDIAHRILRGLGL
jgi:shikimate kinase